MILIALITVLKHTVEFNSHKRRELVMWKLNHMDLFQNYPFDLQTLDFWSELDDLLHRWGRLLGSSR
jgi:hypothetical protein